MEQRIINMYGSLTPPKILRFFLENSFFQFEHRKHPYAFIILGRGGPTGKTWITAGLRKYGFFATELSESLIDLVEYMDGKNHVIKDDTDKNIIIVLNESWGLKKAED